MALYSEINLNILAYLSDYSSEYTASLTDFILFCFQKYFQYVCGDTTFKGKEKKRKDITGLFCEFYISC